MSWGQAIAKFFGFGENLTEPKQYDIKREKRHLYRIEAGMDYIRVDRKTGEYKNISKEKQDKLKIHYAKRVFDVT